MQSVRPTNGRAQGVMSIIQPPLQDGIRQVRRPFADEEMVTSFIPQFIKLKQFGVALIFADGLWAFPSPELDLLTVAKNRLHRDLNVLYYESMVFARVESERSRPCVASARLVV